MRLEVIVPRQLLFDPKRLERVVENTLNEAATAVKADFNVTTRTWDNRPPFYIDKSIGERVVYTDDPIYRYVSGGTRVRRVIMTPGFSPKSRHRYIGANKGSGGVMAGPSMKISRPGIKAREFAETIKEKWDKELPDQLQRAIDAETR